MMIELKITVAPLNGPEDESRQFCWDIDGRATVQIPLYDPMWNGTDARLLAIQSDNQQMIGSLLEFLTITAKLRLHVVLRDERIVMNEFFGDFLDGVLDQASEEVPWEEQSQHTFQEYRPVGPAVWRFAFVPHKQPCVPKAPTA